MKTRQEILDDLEARTLRDKGVTKKSVIKGIEFEYPTSTNRFYHLVYLQDYTYTYFFSEESLLTKIGMHV